MDKEQLSAAQYRDQLLEVKLSDGGEGSEDNALVIISIGRLKKLICRKKREVCSEQAQTRE